MAGKGKGSAFERHIAKLLSLWWTDQKRDDIFWRSQTSGARATQRKKAGKTTANQDGDLTAMDICGQPLIDFCSIELKCGYPAFTIDGLVNRPRLKKSVLKQFVDQCKREVEGTNRFWWLIVKQNLREELFIFPLGFSEWLRQEKVHWRKLDHIILKFEENTVCVVRLNEMLEILKPSLFLKNEKNNHNN